MQDDAKALMGAILAQSVSDAQFTTDTLLFNAYSELVEVVEKFQDMIFAIDQVNDSRRVDAEIARYYPAQISSIDHYRSMRDKFGGK